MTHKPMTQDEVLAVLDAAGASFDSIRFERRHAEDAAEQNEYWSKRIAEVQQARATIAAWNVSPSADVVGWMDPSDGSVVDSYTKNTHPVPGKYSAYTVPLVAQLAQQGGESK